MLAHSQKKIYRTDMKANPKTLYVFGDNLDRVGFGGQAKEMRGEPNAHGIVTKRKAAHGSKDCYFWDEEKTAWEAVTKDINTLEEKIRSGDWDELIFPEDGIGTGLAKLSETAPKLLAYINERLTTIEILINSGLTNLLV